MWAKELKGKWSQWIFCKEESDKYELRTTYLLGTFKYGLLLPKTSLENSYLLISNLVRYAVMLLVSYLYRVLKNLFTV